jgi:small GTP-binding protein
MSNKIPEIKMILLGESGVGKTSIIKRVMDEDFNENESCSLTMTYSLKEIVKNHKNIKLNIWDTIGQEQYRSIAKLFLNDTKIVILVYSIIVEKTFKELEFWYNLCIENLGPNIVFGVIGNKVDLFLEQKVSENEGKEFADKHNALFGLFSAKDIGYKEQINMFVNELVKRYLEKEDPTFRENEEDNNKIKLNVENHNNTEVKGGNGCCSGGKKKTKQKKYESILKNNNGFITSVFLGDEGVGKTSLIKRIMGEEFDQNELHTDDIKENLYNYNNNSMKLKLKIFDINNDNKNSNKANNAMAISDIYFLVYNIKNKQSLDNIENWIENIKTSKKESKNKNNYQLVIIGNKNDKENESNLNENEERIIKEAKNGEFIEEGKQLSKKYKSIFILTSAFDNKGLENILDEAIEKYLNKK